MKKLLLTLGVVLGFVWQALAVTTTLPSNIQDGNILHCFDWKFTDIQAELPNIAAAGFVAVQTSPVQRNCSDGAIWYDAYRPYDYAFVNNGLGTRAQLTALCTAAHALGVKVIVDVVANHLDGGSYHNSWWDSNNRSRSNGTNINYGDRYSITHGQLIGGPDCATDNTEVQNRAKAFVQDLKSIGVDGIRWDAAKHIGVPSEGDQFWPVVTSVAGMYHYGEILDSPGGSNGDNLAKEYANYITITDNGYGTDCRNSVNGGSVPSGYANWAARGVADRKVLYWGESHDTYSNDGGESKNVSQDKIDRAWAIGACRNGATSLYFSRPSATASTSIKYGTKGSTHFTSNQIKAVNQLRNAAGTAADYYSQSNGVACITRQGIGACIVVGNGQSKSVSMSNGGGYAPAGTYTDIVTGSNQFTVTSTTISGTVGSTGIAVLIKNGAVTPTPTPDPTPDPTPTTGNRIYFDNSAVNWSTPTIHYWGGTTSSTWPGVAMTLCTGNIYYFDCPTGTTGLLFNAGDGDASKTGDLTFAAGHLYKATGNHAAADQGAYTGSCGGSTPDPEPEPQPTTGNTIYFNNQSANWSIPYVHYWGGTTASNWPGEAMALCTGNVYYFDCPTGTTGLVFNNNGAPQTNDLVFAAGHIYEYGGANKTGSDKGAYTGSCGSHPTSVEDLTAGTQIYGLQGQVRIENAAQQPVVIYSTVGQMMASFVSTTTSETVALPVGMYLVKAGDKTCKVVVY